MTPYITMNQQPWVLAMEDCIQDTRFHQEGSVYKHTQMVIDSLPKDHPELQILHAAATLHDVAKPLTRKEEPDGHVSFKHHAAIGAILSRKILWEIDVPFTEREKICNLVRHHMRPYHLWDNNDPVRNIMEVSTNSNCELLSILAKADIDGRTGDKPKSHDLVELFREYAIENNCLDHPFNFNSPHARYTYFNRAGWTPDNTAYDDTRCKVIVMSGLPGAGKDHWVKNNCGNLPVVSLDEIRTQLNIKPSESQGKVVAEAKQRAKVFLGQKQDFVWNATNISKMIRQEVIALMQQYNAYVQIVYVDTPRARLFEQNKQRSHPVPENIIEHLVNKWEVPTLTEAHDVLCIENRC